MENPYAAHDLTPELVEEERRRPKLSRALLTAYAVHHLFSILGLLVGLVVKPSEWRHFCPPDNPLEALAILVFIPLIDVLNVLEPLVLRLAAPQQITIWHWLRIPLTLSIPVACFMYAKSRRRDWLWYLAIVSFGVFLSFVLWNSPIPPRMGP
jgi:hypothetical protein